MNPATLAEPFAALLVLGGTLLATVLGSGRAELAATLGALHHLFQRPFRYDAARAEIAPYVESIRHDGVLRAPRCLSSDEEIAVATDALIHDRSIAALIDAHEAYRQHRQQTREQALRALRLGGELAPVAGMAGTLFALSQLPRDGLAGGSIMGAVALAVLTTLYGLLLAHGLLHPLARLVERRGEREEAERQQLIDWLAAQLAAACPASLRDGRDQHGPQQQGRAA